MNTPSDDSIPPFLIPFNSLHGREYLLKKANEILLIGKEIRNLIDIQINEQKKLIKQSVEPIELDCSNIRESIKTKFSLFKDIDDMNEERIEIASNIIPYFSDLRSLYYKKDTIINDIELNPPLQSNIESNVEEFNAQIDNLQDMLNRFSIEDDRFDDKTKKEKYRIPWQLVYSKELDTTEEKPVVDFSGSITDDEGNPLWREKCCVCHEIIQDGIYGAGTPRYRCMECPGRQSDNVLCLQCFEVLREMYLWCNNYIKNNETIEQNINIVKDLMVKMESINIHLSHNLSLEHDIYIFTRLQIKEAPTLATFINNILLAYNNRPLFGTKTQSKVYQFQTYNEIRQKVFQFASGLRRFVKPGEYIGLSISYNRYEYYIADMSCALNSLVSVPIYSKRSVEDIIYMIKTSSISCIICSDDIVLRFINDEILNECKSIRTVISIGDKDYDHPDIEIVKFSDVMTYADENCQTYSNVNLNTPIISSKQPIPKELSEKDDSDDFFSIIFTSGSTNRPKGVIVTCKNWLEDISKPESPDLTVLFSWLPSEMGADRMLVWEGLYNGAQIGFSSHRDFQLIEDIQILRPTMIFSPPALWNTLYNQFCYLLNFELSNNNNNKDESIHDKVMRSFASILGDRIQFIGTGGASISSTVTSFLQQCFKQAKIVTAYGATECGGIASNDKRLPNTQIKIDDVPELGYYSTDIPYPRGELLVKPEFKSKGYFKDPDATKKAFTEDGWYRTGDIVEWNKDNDTIHVIDRRSNIFKLSNSEFVCPNDIESKLCNDLVSQIFIYGDSSMDQVMGVVIPINNNIMKSDIMKRFKSLKQKYNIPSHKMPRDILLLPVEDMWTIENGYLTPTMKLCRPKLIKSYGERLKSMYLNSTSFEFDEINENNNEETDLWIISRRNEIHKIVYNCLGISDIDWNKTFTENGGDSLKTMLFVQKIKTLLNKDDQDISPLFLINQPLDSVVSFILNQSLGMKEAYSKYIKQTILDDLTNLKNELIENNEDKEESSNTQSCDDILITGATGFLGIHVLESFLSGLIPLNSRVYVLVRGKNKDEAESRLRYNFLQACSHIMDDYDNAVKTGKVIIVEGDISSHHLGMDCNLYEQLKESVGLVYHCASDVSFTKSYASLRQSNVIGTSNLIKFCNYRKKILVHISTISCIVDKQNIVKENLTKDESLLNSFIINHESYSLTKLVSEHLVYDSILNGVISKKSVIIRPGFIASNSKSGYSNTQDWLYRLIQASIYGKAIPPLQKGFSRINIIPVDICAISIIITGLLQRNNNFNSLKEDMIILHSVNEEFTDLSDILNCILEYDNSIIQCNTMKEWFEIVSNSDGKNYINPLLPFLSTGLPTDDNKVKRYVNDNMKTFINEWNQIYTPKIEYKSIVENDIKFMTKSVISQIKKECKVNEI